MSLSDANAPESVMWDDSHSFIHSFSHSFIHIFILCGVPVDNLQTRATTRKLG